MLLTGAVMLKNTSEAVETGQCLFPATGLSTFSKVGLAKLVDTLLPATPEFSSSICTSVLKAVLEPTVEIDSPAKSKFEGFKPDRDARKAELESSFIPAIEVVVTLLSNAVPSARPMIESTEFDVDTTLLGNDFVLPTNWSMTSRRSVSENPDIPKSKLVGLALEKPLCVVAGCCEGLLVADVPTVGLELLDIPTIKADWIVTHCHNNFQHTFIFFYKMFEEMHVL